MEEMASVCQNVSGLFAESMSSKMILSHIFDLFDWAIVVFRPEFRKYYFGI